MESISCTFLRCGKCRWQRGRAETASYHILDIARAQLREIGSMMKSFCDHKQSNRHDQRRLISYLASQRLRFCCISQMCHTVWALKLGGQIARMFRIRAHLDVRGSKRLMTRRARKSAHKSYFLYFECWTLLW